MFDTRYKFTAKELDNETNYTYFGARYYDSELSGWLSVDPMSDKYLSTSAYMYCLGNPVKLIDPNGERPLPLDNTYNNWYVKVDSWFGTRNTGLPGASNYHKGLDFNYSGGGNTDYGSPIFATHEGFASVDNNPSGGEGRSVVITSPDGTFRTRYFHLSEINIEDGQYVSESYNIAQMGGSAYGDDLGRTSHLHYEIPILKDGEWVSINPTGDQENEISNILDPQKWITPDSKIYNSGILPKITISATLQEKQIIDNIE